MDSKEQDQTTANPTSIKVRTKSNKRKEILRFRAKCCQNCAHKEEDMGFFSCMKDNCRVSPTISCKQFEYVYLGEEAPTTTTVPADAEENLRAF